MKKIAVFVFGLSLLVIAGLAFFQYQGFSENVDAGTAPFSYTQEIEVIYSEQALQIRHTFNDLPNQPIPIAWSTQANEMACYVEATTSCDRLADDAYSFLAGETSAQTVVYNVPLANGLPNQLLLEQIFAQLPNGTATNSVVHVSTANAKKGQWVTGLPLTSSSTLEGITYTMFSGAGNVYDLYWQAGDFALKASNEELSVYSAYNVTDKFMQEVERMAFSFNDHVALIQANQTTTHENSRFIFLPMLNLASVKEQIVATQVAEMFTFVDTPAWLQQLMIAEIGETAITEARAQQVIEALQVYLSKSQQQSFSDRLQALKGKEVSPLILDDILSDVLGAKTTFFTRNATSETFFPIVEEDTRGVYVNEVRIDELAAILYNDRVYYAAQPLLTELGYEASAGTNGYYVNNHEVSYRFPITQLFYVYNERRYDTKSRPVDKIGGQYYIEEAWLVRLFDVDLRKKDRVIEITTIPVETRVAE